MRFIFIAIILLSASAHQIHAAPLQITEQRRIGEVVYNVQRSTNFHELRLRLIERSKAGEWAANRVTSYPLPGLYSSPLNYGGSLTPHAAARIARHQAAAKAQAANPKPQPLPPVAYILDPREAERTLDGMIVLRNIPLELDPVTDRAVAVRAMRVGTTNLPTMTLEVWDCGIPELPARP